MVYTTFLPSSSLADNQDYTYELYVHSGVSWEKHVLHVSTVTSLYEYYRGRSHDMDDPSKFVTPDAFHHVAEDLWRVFKDKVYGEEEFANSVLMLVHQIPYEASVVRYAVETLMNDKGDCDTLSYLAASILKAGGLDVVLIEYTDRKHMNIGVHLSHAPVYSTSKSATYYNFTGKKYYVAECTSQGVDVRDDWRVGDYPKDLIGAKVHIRSLGQSEETSPAQVASSVDTSLAQSSITLTLSSDTYYVGDSVELSGSTSPRDPGRPVVLYLSSTRFYWSVLTTLETDSTGRYSYQWRPSLSGTWYIRASYSGVKEVAAADSETHTLTISLQADAVNNIVAIGFTLMAALSMLLSFSVSEIIKTIIDFL